MSSITKRNLLLSAKIALLGSAAIALNACSDDTSNNASSSDAQDSTSPSLAGVELPDAQGSVDMEKVLEAGPLKDMVLGDDNAPVTIVEYASMTCPHCAAFHATTYKEIKSRYVDTGKVRFILREFPFDPRAAAASMLARCGDEKQYFPLIDAFFSTQSSWAQSENAREALFQVTKIAGFTQESFEACLTDQKLLDDVYAVRNRGAEEFGIQSTPSFIIDGKRYAGNMSVEQMSALIESLL